MGESPFLLNATINVHLDPSKGRYSEVLENIEEIQPLRPPPDCNPLLLGGRGRGGKILKNYLLEGVSKNFTEFEGKFKIA